MAVYDVGDAVPLRHEVRDADGTLTATTVAVTVTDPNGVVTSPVVTSASIGVYDAAPFVVSVAGLWTFAWHLSGVITDVVPGSFLVLVQAPPAYVPVSAVKAALGKLTSDDRDELIAQSVRSASRLIDRRTGRRFWSDNTATARTYGLRSVVRDGDGYGLLVDDIATESGLIASVAGTAVVGLTTGPRNAAALGRPITMVRPATPYTVNPFTDVITVTARWGWPYVPDEVEQAVTLLAARLYRRKDSPQGVIGSADWGVVRVGRVDPDVEALIAHLILPGIA